jgi:hypothetical protein
MAVGARWTCSVRLTEAPWSPEPPGRWQRAARGAAQLADLVDDVQQNAVEADSDPLPGRRHADTDLPTADTDPAAAVDQPVDLHRRGLWSDGR